MENKYKLELEIKDFLKEVEAKLPSWLKDDKWEKHEILSELEEHIWDKAEELAAGQEISAVHIHQAIVSMGTPEAITKEYKKRGTPRVYITEEWWEIYKKVLLIVTGVLVGINLIVFFAQIISKPFGENISGLFQGLWGALLPALGIVTLIFVALSMEGYLPHDFKDFAEKNNIHIDLKTDIKSEISREIKHEFAKERALKKVNPPIKTKGLLGEAIWGFFWAILLVVQPIAALNAFFTAEFLGYVQLIGVLQIAESILKLAQVFAGVQRTGSQQMLLLANIIIDILYIQRYLAALQIAGVLQIFATWWDATVVFRIILWITIIGTGIGILEKLGRIASYPSKLERYNEYKDRFRELQ